MTTSLRQLALDDPAWGSFVDSRPDAGPFHHPSWAATLSAAYGFEGFAVGLVDDRGRLRAGLPVLSVRHRPGPHRWVALPFTDVCPVLGRDEVDRSALVDRLAAEAGTAPGGVPPVELRTEVEASGAAHASPTLWHRVALSDGLDATTARVHASHRRNVRAATRHGVSVRVSRDRRDLVERFYRLHVGTRRRQGSPVQPRRYFDLLWELVISRGRGTVILAEHRGRPIAAAVFLNWGSTAVYKYGASDENAWHLRPNDLVMWEGLSCAVATGAQDLDLGRTAVGNPGLARFKRGWGATESELRYTTLGDVPARPPERPVPAAVRTILQRAPTGAVRLLGAALYRRAA